MTQRTEKRPDTFVGLDLVRLAAALLVTCYHLSWKRQSDDPSFHLAFAKWFSSGWVGVEIFFVLSGFVIAFSAQGRSVGEFIRSRARRLYPAAWLCATATFVLCGGTVIEYVASLILWPYGPWIDGSYWTLPVEMAFYVLVAIALAYRWPLHHVAIGLGLYSSIFWVAKLINRFYPYADFSFVDNNAGYLLLLHFGIHFAAGILIFARSHKGFLLAFLTIGFVEIVWRAVGQNDQYLWLAALTWVTAVGFIFASIKWRSAIELRFSPKVARRLGLMTYPLYLIHQKIGVAIERFFSNSSAAFAVSLVVVISIAALILPAENFIRKISLGRLRGSNEQPSLP